VILVACITFSLIGYYIYLFSQKVTQPIERLTDHTQHYKQAKGLTEKSFVIKQIKEDKIFERFFDSNEGGEGIVRVHS